MKSADAIKQLALDGWHESQTRGRHHQFKHPVKRGVITIPRPQEDLTLVTIRGIEKRAGIKLR